MLLSAGNEWSRSYREINQHPNLPSNFITHGFLDPSAFPEKCMCFSCPLISEKASCPQSFRSCFWAWKWLRQLLRQFYERLRFLGFLLQENLHAHEIPPFRGEVFWIFVGGGGWNCRFCFLWARDFSVPYPDPAILAFCSISLLFSISDFPCFVVRFPFLFPGILVVPRREKKALAFCWVSLASPPPQKKNKGWRVRVIELSSS